MSKELVDRELLERIANKAAFLHDTRKDQDKLAAILAQTAEAEGTVQCPASHPAECYAPGTQVVHASLVHGIVRKADELIAALSAATAERDAARTDLATVIGQRDCYANQVLRLETTVTAERDRLRGTVEDLELALQDAEERAESAGRNASAFEDRMGDLQVENGQLQGRIRPLMAFTQQMARQEGEPYFQRLARAAMAAKEA